MSFEERRIGRRSPITESELKRLLALTENGVEEIFSILAFRNRELGNDIEEYTLNEIIKLMIADPALIKMPLITDGKKLNVGFNEEHIRRFIPGEQRVQQLRDYYLSTENDVATMLEEGDATLIKE